MMKSSSKSFDVFDFKEEEEALELNSAKLVNRIKFSTPFNKKSNLFEKATKGTHFQINEMGTLPFVEDDGKGGNHNCDNGVSYTAVHMEEDTGSLQMCGLDGMSLFNSSSRNCHPQSVPDTLKSESFSAQLAIGNSSLGGVSPGHSPLLRAPSESPSSTESADTTPDVDDSVSESSSTSSDVSGAEVPLGGHDSLSGHCFGDYDMGEGDIAVCPDYVVCQGRYYTNAALCFSNSCLRLKGISVYGNQGASSFQWEVNDIVEIESEWSKRIEVARVRLSLISKDSVAAQESTSGIEQIHFGVFDSNWPDKQERIMSLDVRYKAIWNVAFRTDTVDGEALRGQSHFVIPRRRYFPNFNEPFDEVVFPKGDPDAVSISKRDVDLLQPDTFVNDTIIDFYIKYLKNEIEPERRQRFHFFNSFFFRKLIDLDKDSPSDFEGRAAFQRVRKWTRKVNLFEKDYVFIPVNYNYHWSLIVICHPGEIAKCPEEDFKNLHKVPCILHMDSIKGTHSGLKDFVQSYLWEEWKEKQKDACEDTSTKFSNLRFVPLELPQQQNCFDCGLFLLHYAEHFLEEAPRNFSPFKITKFSNFADWFPPGEPTLKRVYIQKLILKILEGENSPTASSDKPCPSNYRPTNNNDTETGVELLVERCSPSKSFQKTVCNPNADQGIEITLLPTSAGDSGMVFREFFEDGADPAEVFPRQFQGFDRAPSFGEFRGAPSPTEQVEEGAGAFPSNITDYQQLTGMNFETSDYSYTFKDLEGETSHNAGLDEHGDGDINASTETSLCASEDSLKVEVKDSNGEELDRGKGENMDQPSSITTENIEYNVEYLAENLPNVADSQSPDCNGDQFVSLAESPPRDCQKDCDAQDDGYVSYADEPCLLGGGGSIEAGLDGQKEGSGTETNGLQSVKRISEDLEQESEDMQPSKRPRVEPTNE